MEKILIFLSFFLGFLSVLLMSGFIVFAKVLKRRTKKLTNSLDERAKNLIIQMEKRQES